jgi:hypothetical protein
MLDLSGFLDMPDAEYRAAPGENWSALKIIGDSPLLYEHRKRTPRADTGAFVFGRAFHAALLQPEVYRSGWKVYNGDSRKGKDWDRFVRLYGDEFEIVLEEEAERIVTMVARTRAHDEAAMILDFPGINERAAFWMEGGRRMKAKLDRLCWQPGALEDPSAPLFVVDAKTTRDLKPEQFGRAADNYGYAGQMEHYTRGAEILTRRQCIPILLAVEKEAPHDVGLFRVPDHLRGPAGRYRQSLLDKLARCESEQHWPGRVPTMIDLPVPKWSKLRGF